MKTVYVLLQNYLHLINFIYKKVIKDKSEGDGRKKFGIIWGKSKSYKQQALEVHTL